METDMTKAAAKVIHVMHEPPAYEQYADKPRPAVNWDTPQGQWVGIWGYDWADLLAMEVKKVNDAFVHEIWQPDLRADKIYSREIYHDVTHRLIPAASQKMQLGLKRIERVDFSGMTGELARDHGHAPAILNVSSFHVLDQFRKTGIKNKIVFSFMGDIRIPIQGIGRPIKNMPAKVNQFLEHLAFKKSLKTLSAVTYMNGKNLDLFKRYYSGPLEKITMGVDFDQWRRLDKKACRLDLQLPPERTILFTSSRLNELKQVDRLIQVLQRLSRKHDFLFIISGHGTRQYEEYLRTKAKHLCEKNAIEFIGYVPEEKLLKFYSACDLFMLTSLSEGASVSVIKALACETPVFSTAVGNTAEVMSEHGAGIIVPPKDYASWETQLKNFFSGASVKLLPIVVARRHYHWSYVARKFSDIYQGMV